MRSPLRSSRPAAWERRSRAWRTSPSSWPYLKVRPEREWTTAVESGSWRETASKRGRRGRVESILAAGRSETKGEVRDGTDEGGRRTAEERSDRRRDIVKPEGEGTEGGGGSQLESEGCVGGDATTPSPVRGHICRGDG